MDADRNDNVWYTRVLIDEKARKKLYDALRTDVADGNIDILNLKLQAVMIMRKYNLRRL